jgi:hypothetical protein
MSACTTCRLEAFCFYPYKPTECVGLRKYWDETRRREWDEQQQKQPSSEGKADEQS